MILSSAETFSLFSFAVFSLYDLRFRLAPAIEVFLLAAAVLACWTTPLLQVIMVILAVLWGLGDWLPGWLPVILLISSCHLAHLDHWCGCEKGVDWARRFNGPG